jgi:hypothetical protein
MFIFLLIRGTRAGVVVPASGSKLRMVVAVGSWQDANVVAHTNTNPARGFRTSWHPSKLGPRPQPRFIQLQAAPRVVR